MRRPSSTAATMVAKLSSASTISATFLVTSVPVMPMPIPISAFLMEGASFTPSPVMAVTLPRACHAFTIRTLCSGCTRAYTEYFSTAPPLNSASLISLSCAPVIACEASSTIPSCLAMATAVSIWSPVIITGRMPALWHSLIASTTSGRTGSIMPVMPTKIKSCSSASGLKSVGGFSYSRLAQASTRSALFAMRRIWLWISSRLSSVSGLITLFSSR